MTIKTIALAILACFLVFSCSCIYSYKKTPLLSVKPEERAEAQISAVQIHSGEKTELKKKPPARIHGDTIIGERLLKNFILERSKIKNPGQFSTGAPAAIITVDGGRYTAERILSQNASSVTFDGYVTVSIPLADVNLVWIRKVNVLATVLLYLGPVLAFEIIESIIWSEQNN